MNSLLGVTLLDVPCPLRSIAPPELTVVHSRKRIPTKKIHKKEIYFLPNIATNLCVLFTIVNKIKKVSKKVIFFLSGQAFNPPPSLLVAGPLTK